MQSQIVQLDDRLTELTEQIAGTQTYLGQLEAKQTEMDAEEKALTKKIDAMEADLNRLHEQVYQDTSNLGEWITRLPILDALYNGNIKIDQIWLPDLTINYNFTQAARFDRCKSCHRAISQTAAGTPTDPAYPTIPPSQRKIVLSLDTPDGPPEDGPPEDGQAGDGHSDPREKLKRAYGLVLADEGIIDFDEGIIDHEDVTVLFVVPESPAARAGLKSGDVILQVGDMPIHERAQVDGRNGSLLKNVAWGTPVSLTIRRGLKHPFTSHPRLGSLS